MYQPFSVDTSKETTVLKYKSKGYYLIVQPNGKKVALFNPYNGKKVDVVQLSDDKKWKKRFILLKDIRKDGSTEAVIVLKKDKKVKVIVVRVKPKKENVIKKDSLVIQAKNTKVKKTKATKKYVNLKNSDGKIIREIRVNSKYRLKEK